MLPFTDLYPEEGWIQKLDLDMKFTSGHDFWVYGWSTGGLLGMVIILHVLLKSNYPLLTLNMLPMYGRKEDDGMERGRWRRDREVRDGEGWGGEGREERRGEGRGGEGRGGEGSGAT